MIKFDILPYVGPQPLEFTMNADQVAAILGPPQSVDRSDPDSVGEQRDKLSLGYGEDGLLDEVVFCPGLSLFYKGVDLFVHADPIGFLTRYDQPFEHVGFICFVNLGIRLSGFHDGDESQKAIGVVRKGHWDEMVSRFEPYSPG